MYSGADRYWSGLVWLPSHGVVVQSCIVFFVPGSHSSTIVASWTQEALDVEGKPNSEAWWSDYSTGARFDVNFANPRQSPTPGRRALQLAGRVG